MTEKSDRELSFQDQEKKFLSRKGNNVHLITFIVVAIMVCCLAIFQVSVYRYQSKLEEEMLTPVDKFVMPKSVLQPLNGQTGHIVNCTQSKVYRDVNDILDYVPIRAGEIHFARVPREYWEHRLQMIKGLGLNTVSVYIFWNFHEITPGIFDFENGERDLIGFLKLAAKYKLHVLFRPGPYVCAEWDFGGLPARLLGVKDLKIRSSNKLYEDQVFIYFTALSKVIKPFLKINGGNIIMLQIENQFGSYGNDSQHTFNLLQMWKNLEVQTNFYYEDAQRNWQKHYWNGSNFGISEGQHLNQYTLLQKSESFKDRLIFGGQVYSGWLTHWGENWHGLEISAFQSDFKGLLDNNRSFSIYVVHGGTNFGLSAGANDFTDSKYSAHVTSYDYDAPINEQGSATKKYQLLRELMQKHTTVEPVPEPIKTIEIEKIQLTQYASLLENLRDPVSLKEVTYFESDELRMYHQGIVVYETTLEQRGRYELTLLIHDYALILVDYEKQGEVVRDTYSKSKRIVECRLSKCVLRLLVEAYGHVNYGELQPLDRKGILFMELKKGEVLRPEWKAYRVLLNETGVLDAKAMNPITDGPVFKGGSFELQETGDTYLDMAKSTKGYVWVNDRLLGRYWNIGPQHRLYCPGVWLKKGKNEIRILEFSRLTTQSLSSKRTLT